MKRSLVALLLGLLVACRPIPAPQPPTPPPPAPILYGAVDVSTSPRLPAVAILIDGAPFEGALEPNCHQTDETGASFCSNVPVGTHQISIANLPPGAEAQATTIVGIEAGATTYVVFQVVFPPPPPPPPGLMIALTINGLGFEEGGKPWVYRGFTDFLLYQKYLAGNDLDAILRQRVALGANIVRVLGMVTSFSHFYPQEHGDYYDRLGSFADLLASYGLRVEFVVFADAQVVMPATSDEEAHLDRVVAALAPKTNVLLEIANEPFKNLPGGADAAVALMHRARGKGLLIATGNYDFTVVGSTYLAPEPGDYVTTHPERKPEWPRTSKDAYDLRDGFDGWTGFHRPVVSDEPMGAAEVDAGSRSAQPDDFAYFAAESVLAGAGATFHSDQGILSQPLSGTQLLAAQAFFAAQRWVPAIAQFSPYQRGDANGGPGIGNMPLEHTDAQALRTFCKFANGDEYCVVIRPSSSWVAIPRDGWRILDQSGPHGALVHLGR